MAVKITETRTSDLSGKEGAEAFSFQIGSQGYTVDLVKSEIDDFLKGISKFVDVSTKVSARSASRTSGSRRPSNSTGEDPKVIRAWLQEAGYSVNPRGRISADLLAAYESKTPAPKA